MKSKFLAFVFLLIAQVALAGEFTSDMRVDTVTQFWYRGQLAENNIAIQPSYTVSNNTVTGSIWSNYSSLTQQFDEVDGYASYTIELDTITATLGSQLYLINGLYNTIDVNLLLASSKGISLLMVCDFLSRNGFYEELVYAPKINIAKTQLIIAMGAACNVHYARVDSGMSHVYGQLSLPLPIGDFKIIPSIYHQEPLANDIAQGTFGQITMDASF